MNCSKGTQEDALSPSMITDYFRSSKPTRRGQKEKSCAKEDNPSSSVYLTPESSPGSYSKSEILQKENNSQEDLSEKQDQSLELNVKTSNQTHCSDSIVRSEPCNISSSNEVTDHDLRESKLRNLIQFESAIKSTASCSDSLQSPKKCSCPEENSVTNDDHTKQSIVHSSESSSPSVVAIRSHDSNAACSPPCLPRLKLRKSALANSQADAAVIGKEREPLKPKPGRRKKKDSETVKNSVITDYFQVRRSGRQTTSEIEKEKHHQLQQMILSGCQDGLEVKEFECKGRGVIATKDFKKGDFVVEYSGDLIDIVTARKREEKYATDPEIGCYMYYFTCGSKQYCVDATAESGKLGRLLNHSSKDGNCCTRSLEVKGIARLILVAKRDITSGEELTYDYGDRSKAAIESYPWLKL